MAVNAFRRAHRRNPCCIPAYEGLVQAMALLNRRSEALEAYRHAATLLAENLPRLQRLMVERDAVLLTPSPRSTES